MRSYSIITVTRENMEEIYETIDGYRNGFIQMQTELTALPALGPDNKGTGEHRKAEYLQKMLSIVNPDELYQIHAPDQRAEGGFRPNIVALWNGNRLQRTVWVLSHLDIVPPGDLSLWDGDPYKLRVEDDKLIGRGVEDNQHGIVSSYFAVKGVLDSGFPLPQRVGLIFVADEETSSKYGLDYLLRERKDLFKEEDIIIVPDGGNQEGTMIEIAEKSMLWLKFSVIGRQCHASTPENGKNSLFGAARLITELRKLTERFDTEDPVFSPPVSTFEPTKMEANIPNVNTIPGKDVFYLDCRILPGYDVDQVIGEAREISKRIGIELDLSIEVEVIHREDAAPSTPADSPVVTSLAGAIKKVTGLEARPMGMGGGTVAAFFRKAGLPAAVWATTSPTAHQPNEYCLIKNLLTDAKIMATVFLET